jgi:hypothetical protein
VSTYHRIDDEISVLYVCMYVCMYVMETLVETNSNDKLIVKFCRVLIVVGVK